MLIYISIPSIHIYMYIYIYIYTYIHIYKYIYKYIHMYATVTCLSKPRCEALLFCTILAE